jgi:phosphate uptake regulator
MSDSDSHIVSSFDRDLEALQAHLLRMGGMVETALVNAAKALEAPIPSSSGTRRSMRWKSSSRPKPPA